MLNMETNGKNMKYNHVLKCGMAKIIYNMSSSDISQLSIHDIQK